MQVSVIILTYNRRSDLKRCLNSIMRQTFENLETIVIDNASTDDTAFLLKKFPVRVIWSPVKNKSYLRNLGWLNASGDIVAYIDDDAEADATWLEKIVDTFEKFKDAGAVGGPALTTRKSEIVDLYKAASHSTFLGFVKRIYETLVFENKLFEIGMLFESGAYSIGGSLQYSSRSKHPIPIDITSTCNLAVRREVISEIRGFDEIFLFNHEDGDLCVRIKKAGYKVIFNPRAKVLHHMNPEKMTRATPYNMGRDFALFFVKNVRPKSLSGWLRFTLNIIFFNVYWFYKVCQTKKIVFLRGTQGFLSAFIHYPKIRYTCSILSAKGDF